MTDVVFAFDVEDVVHPESDDALLRLCRIFSEEEVPVSLFVAGEKARTRRRARCPEHASAVCTVPVPRISQSIGRPAASTCSKPGWAMGLTCAAAQWASHAIIPPPPLSRSEYEFVQAVCPLMDMDFGGSRGRNPGSLGRQAGSRMHLPSNR